MKFSLKKHKAGLIAVGIVLLIAAAWLLLWNHVGNQVQKAAYEASFDTLVFSGAYYQRCDLVTVQDYLPDTAALDASLCGSRLGEVSMPAVCPLFACKPLEDAGKQNAVILMQRDAEYIPYELTGFQYLDDSPSIWAVCSSYGIGDATDFESVTVRDASDNVLETIDDPQALSAFYEKFLKLGDDLSDEEQSQRYYDAYVSEFGESEKIYMEDGKVQTADTETYDAAMQFWTTDLKKVDLRLKNGLQLRGCIYAPKPGIFSVYGDYVITDDFFIKQ